MVRLSVTIVTRDEERDLPACLESVAFADEIVVVDSGSTDRTREIAAAAGAKVVENPWPGYAAQKAFALERATGDWVLNLDADERCSPALRAAIPAALDSGEVDGFDIRFETHLFGKRARFGGVGRERHVRLFRRAAARYPPRRVHEGAEVARVGRLDAPIVHHPYASLHEYFDKFNRYTTEAARDMYEAGRRFNPLVAALRLPWGFLKRYVFQLGLLDGWTGFLFAALSGWYDFVKMAKLADLDRGR